LPDAGGASPSGSDTRAPLAAGFLCYLIWGFVPLAFQAMGRLGASPWEILVHRTLWGAPTALLFVILTRHLGPALAVFRSPRLLGALALSTLLLATNWILYIWAVNSGRVIEASLGYYITPLINMAAGVMIFRERIDGVGWASVALAAVGVVLQAAAMHAVPWLPITLAISFGAYGVVRKQVAVEGHTGFLIESLLLCAPSLAFALWLAARGEGHFGTSVPATAWLLAAGPITAIPLMLFGWAARRIPLSAMGFLQFVSPTLSFGVGLAEGEAFDALRAASFVFIWAGAALFAFGAWRRTRAIQA